MSSNDLLLSAKFSIVFMVAIVLIVAVYSMFYDYETSNKRTVR